MIRHAHTLCALLRMHSAVYPLSHSISLKHIRAHDPRVPSLWGCVFVVVCSAHCRRPEDSGIEDARHPRHNTNLL